MTVVRVAGQPAALSGVGTLPETVALLDALAADRTALDQQAVARSAVLHAAVGGCSDREVRRYLLACRRAVHAGRPPRPPAPEVAARLPPAVRAVLTELTDQHRALAGRHTAAEAAFVAERAGADTALARAAADPEFLCGLAMASDALLPATLAWLAGPASHPGHTDTRRRVVAYLLRAAVKTSPFSSFTGATTAGGPVGGPAPVRLSTPGPARRRVELNNTVENLIEAALLARHGARRLRANPTLTRIDGAGVLVHPDGRILRVPDGPAVRCATTVARHGANPEAVHAALSAELGGHPDAVADVVSRLIGAGVLQADLDVADQTEDRLDAVADAVGLPADAAVRRIRPAVLEVADATDGHPRWTAVARLRATVAAAAVESGADLTLPRKHLCYEDVTPGWTAATRPDWTEYAADLRRAVSLSGPFDPALPGRLAVAEVLRRTGGAPRSAVQAWLDWNQAMAGPSGSRLSALRDNPYFLDHSGVPAVAELVDVQDRLTRLLTGPADGPGSAERTATFDALLAGIAPGLRWRGSATLFVQPRDDGRLVLNTTACSSAVDARLRRDPAIRSVPTDPGRDHRLPVALTGLFGSTLNRAAPIAAHELAWPGCVPAMAPAHRVHPADLRVELDPDTDLAGLWWTDREIELVQPGPMARFWLPPAVRFLLDLTTSAPTTSYLSARDRVDPWRPQHTVRLAEASVGRMVYDRRSWAVPRRDLPTAAPTAFATFGRVRDWCAELGLPSFVFARVLDLQEVAGPGGALGKNRKPRPLDLHSWWGAEELTRLAGPSGVVVFAEATPAVGGAGRVVEYAVDTGRPEPASTRRRAS